MKMREYLTIQHLLHLNDLDWRFVPDNIKNEHSDSEEDDIIQNLKKTSWISENHDKFSDLYKHRRNPKILNEKNLEDFNGDYLNEKFRECP